MNPLQGATQTVSPLLQTDAQRKMAERKKLEKTAGELEGVFLSLVIKQMQATVPQDGLFNNNTTQIFTEMLDDELGRIVAKGHGLGLAQSIIRSVERQQAPVRQTLPTSSKTLQHVRQIKL